MKKRYQYWFLYFAAWVIYAASLGVVFIWQGNLPTENLLPVIFCNVAPGALLGIVAVRLCDNLVWANRRRTKFLVIHISLAISFAVLWCGFNCFAFSVLNFIEHGVWTFNWLNSYALQWQLFSGLMAYFTICSSVYVRQVNEHLKIEEQRNAELELRAIRAEAARSQAELASLRGQLNPHFLFNTLHSLMALIRTDTHLAEEAVERFALMLRYVLQTQDGKKTAQPDVTFADEWNFTQNYLELERLRLGDRLNLTTEIEPSALNFYLPAFSLQPLVENAVKHAIASRTYGGRISITARTDENRLVCEISDDGRGATEEILTNTGGLGLRLVRESLIARFGMAAKLEVETAPDSGFKATLMIPHLPFR